MELHPKQGDLTMPSGKPRSSNDGDVDIKGAGVQEVERRAPDAQNFAAIMATNKPNPWGQGYIRLYLLSAIIFLCSTMNGASEY